jgi:hypothetical protein
LMDWLVGYLYTCIFSLYFNFDIFNNLSLSLVYFLAVSGTLSLKKQKWSQTEREGDHI